MAFDAGKCFCRLLKSLATVNQSAKPGRRAGARRGILQRTSCDPARQRRCARRQAEDPALWKSDKADESQQSSAEFNGMMFRIAKPRGRRGRVSAVEEKLAKNEDGRDEVVSGTQLAEMDRGI